MPTTEDLIARLRAVLDHGPVSGSSRQYAIATLNALAQRTRGLEGKLQRVRDAIKFAANSTGGIVAEIDAALAPAEAGSGEAGPSLLELRGIARGCIPDGMSSEEFVRELRDKADATPEPDDAGDGERLDWLEGETTDGPLMNWYVALCEEHGGEAGDLREAIDAAMRADDA